MNEPEEKDPISHLWECLGRWSAYLANNGLEADLAPPSWLVEAVKNATTKAQIRSLTDDEIKGCFFKYGQYVSSKELGLIRAIELMFSGKEKTNV